MKYLTILFSTACFFIATLTGCASSPDYEKMTASPVDRQIASEQECFNYHDDLDTPSLILAIERSLGYYQGPGRHQTFPLADKTFTAAQMAQVLTEFRDILQSQASPEEKQKQIAQKFIAVPASRQNSTILFTGYYEPLLEGSQIRTEQYKYPLYKPPTDLLSKKVSGGETQTGRLENGQLVPYYSRREIDIEGVLQGKNLELLWVADLVELNSLHTQGSGKISLPDKKILTVSYAQSNGRPFRSATQNMLSQNKISKGETTYQGFKTWLKAKSEREILEILSHNERYIFFRLVEKEPVGALGQPVTPGRTIATDPAYYPQGGLAFIRLRKPVWNDDFTSVSYTEFSRFVLNQDKGAAIQGPQRVDLFCGFGSQAQAQAGSLKEKGDLYFLLLK